VTRSGTSTAQERKEAGGLDIEEANRNRGLGGDASTEGCYTRSDGSQHGKKGGENEGLLFEEGEKEKAWFGRLGPCSIVTEPYSRGDW